MARKERNSVDYFPHSVNHGKKMFYLRDRFGNDGYAVWFMLLEQLGKSNYHYLDLSDDIEMMYLSSEFKVSELKLNEIISSLVKFGEFDKELWENNKILFNEKFNENISDAYKKRNNECPDREMLISVLKSKGVQLNFKSTLKQQKSTPKQQKSKTNTSENTQSIVEYSILEETKENDNIYKPSFFSDEVEKCFKECLKYFDKHLHPKDPKKWKEVIEKLNRIDKIPFEQIIRITKKTRENSFWQTNFLSLTKLRQKQKSSGLYYIVVFNEQLKSKSNDTRTNQEIATDAINSETAKNFRFS